MPQDSETREEVPYAQRAAQRNAALASVGFDEFFSVGDMLGRREFATCKTCGAAVALLPGEPNENQPVFTHRAWHDVAAASSTEADSRSQGGLPELPCEDGGPHGPHVYGVGQPGTEVASRPAYQCPGIDDAGVSS